MFEKLKKEVEEAKRSIIPRDALHLAYGKILMAYELKSITLQEYFELNGLCVKEGINNPRFF